MSMEVHPISVSEARPWVEQHHYARRKVGAVHRFGLFEGGELCGVVLYSIPSSYTLCRAVCGPEYKDSVLTLSRLVVNSSNCNAASLLVGRSLVRLPHPSIVVSYADPNEGHTGTVYQASNWLYTGLSSAERNYHLDTGEVVKVRRHIETKGKVVRTSPQLPKHRYIYLVADRHQRRELRAKLRWPILPYPKGPSRLHAMPDVVPAKKRDRKMEYRHCEGPGCAICFPLRRSDARFCCVACRVRAHYHRGLTQSRKES